MYDVQDSFNRNMEFSQGIPPRDSPKRFPCIYPNIWTGLSWLKKKKTLVPTERNEKDDCREELSEWTFKKTRWSRNRTMPNKTKSWYIKKIEKRRRLLVKGAPIETQWVESFNYLLFICYVFPFRLRLSIFQHWLCLINSGAAEWRFSYANLNIVYCVLFHHTIPLCGAFSIMHY